jgi:hypothetical protein
MTPSETSSEKNLLNKAELLNRHVAYTLIKNCLFIPKFNFLLRTTPFWKFSNYVNSIDSSLRMNWSNNLSKKLRNSYNAMKRLLGEINI